MHEGCSGKFNNGKEVVAKLRMMGFDKQYMPIPATIKCIDCGETITMETFEYECPNCKMVYAVTPCHAFDSENIMPAGREL